MEVICTKKKTYCILWNCRNFANEISMYFTFVFEIHWDEREGNELIINYSIVVCEF